MANVDRKFTFQDCCDLEDGTLPNLRSDFSTSESKPSLRLNHNCDHLRTDGANPYRSNLTAEFD
jgi:hypothetical protein